MVIVRKDIETKEIEIQGFRKILKDPKHPDYKELRVYIKQGWIPVDTEDDEKEILKAKKRKQVLKEIKARRPKYQEMEKTIQKLKNDSLLKEFFDKKEIKNNYINVLAWYNEVMKNVVNGEYIPPKENKEETKENKEQVKNAKK